jgi:hypothetical protein
MNAQRKLRRIQDRLVLLRQDLEAIIADEPDGDIDLEVALRLRRRREVLNTAVDALDDAVQAVGDDALYHG